MIRKAEKNDTEAIMKIWLYTNIKSHSFISADYWHSNFEMVKELIPCAEVYVSEDNCTNQIEGFIGFNDNHIEGIFVKEAAQSNGIGKQLLDYAKDIKSALSLNVYQKNERAVRFYQRENFNIHCENIDDNTGEKEFAMIWKN